jgi:hypothetical protein
VPLSNREPAIKGWTQRFCDERPTEAEVATIWSAGHRGGNSLDGVGVACHGGLVAIDVDSDDPGVVDRIRLIMPEIDAAPACIGRRGFKAFFRSEDGENRRELNIGARSTGGALEVLHWYHQAVIPPTIHPKTRRAYRWRDENRTLLTTPLHALPTLTATQIEELRAEFGIAKVKAETRAKAKERQEAERGAEEDSKVWDGDPEELRRYAAALRFLDANDHETWQRVGWGLHRFTRGHHCGRQLFDAWSGGGSFLVVTFPGSVKFNRTTSQDEAWARSAELPAGVKPLTMGGLIHEARQRGFDAKLTNWPELKAKYARRAAQAQVSSTIAQAAAQMPKGGLFIEAKDALKARADIDGRLGNGERITLGRVLRYVNYDHGFAWPGYRRLTDNLRITVRSAQEAVGRLAEAGYVVRVVPPDEMSWEELIAWDRYEIGHGDDTARPHFLLSEPEMGLSLTTNSSQPKGSGDPPPETFPHVGQDCFGDPRPDVPPQELQAGEHVSPRDTTYRLSSSGVRGVSPVGGPVGAGIEPRTVGEWAASNAFPEDLERHCHVAVEGGAGARSFELLAAALNQARAVGRTDTALHCTIAQAISFVTYRKGEDPLRIEDIPSGKFLARLLERVILLLGDDGVALPEYEQFKRQGERNRARAREREAQEPRPSVANPYARARDGDPGADIPF